LHNIKDEIGATGASERTSWHHNNANAD